MKTISFTTLRRILLESIVSEDKTAMIKRLVLPDVEDEKEKEEYKQDLVSFFKSHSNYENKIDWNKVKTLTKKDFDSLISSADNSKNSLKRKEKADIASDIKNIFRSDTVKKFAIVGENDGWLFVAPLNYQAARFCDSSINQGAGAKWCIGWERSNFYWKQHVRDGSAFIMAFNKHYKELSKSELETNLKYMVELTEGGRLNIWTQPDENIGSDVSRFLVDKPTIKKMFHDARIYLDKERGVKYIQIGGEEHKVIDGEVNCYASTITSLKGSPEEVSSIKFADCEDLESLVGGPKRAGIFSCYKCPKITSLEGAPLQVDEAFSCNSCNGLTNLVGAPQVVGRFSCSGCVNLVSLKGAPVKTNDEFDCSYCYSLASLEGAPQDVYGPFDCSNCKNLRSLKGAPEVVDGSFWCASLPISSLEGAPRKVVAFRSSGCPNLTSLKGAPAEVKYDFDCTECDNLKSLDGAPRQVGRNFDCRDCNSLASLEGSPESVPVFNCNQCNSLINLTGGPSSVVEFSCRRCKNLRSLKGAPQEVKKFYCNGCENLTSLVGGPAKVTNNFDCSDCTKLTSLAGAPSYIGGKFLRTGSGITREQIMAYYRFLKNPTPDLMDSTGHYMPKE